MILIILGVIIISWVAYKLALYHKLKTWDEVEGHITKSESVCFEEPQVYVMVTLIRPAIEYNYIYNGQNYKGHTISLDAHSLKENPDNQNFIWSKWVKDQTCPVYVNPLNPHEALLYRGILPNRKSHYLALSIVGMLLIVIGGWSQYVQP